MGGGKGERTRHGGGGHAVTLPPRQWTASIRPGSNCRTLLRNATNWSMVGGVWSWMSKRSIVPETNLAAEYGSSGQQLKIVYPCPPWRVSKNLATSGRGLRYHARFPVAGTDIAISRGVTYTKSRSKLASRSTKRFLFSPVTRRAAAAVPRDVLTSVWATRRARRMRTAIMMPRRARPPRAIAIAPDAPDRSLPVPSAYAVTFPTVTTVLVPATARLRKKSAPDATRTTRSIQFHSLRKKRAR